MPAIEHFSDSEESFHSFDDGEPGPPKSISDVHHEHAIKPNPLANDDEDEKQPAHAVVERFSPEEEASLLVESNNLKGSGNQLFGKGSFENAIQTYDRAVSSCPNYLDYEMAVLRSNIAACHLKLEAWKEAIESATKGVECLDRLEPLPKLKAKPASGPNSGDSAQDDSEELVTEIDDDEAERIENLQKSGHSLDEVRKLQIKLLMRRATAKSRTGGWSALQGADEDYRILVSPMMMPVLSPTDKRIVVEALQKLGPKLTEARESEVAEMMGKLKGLGNSILKPFGLSTNNFQFVKDEKTGGYSMNFSQDGKQ